MVQAGVSVLESVSQCMQDMRLQKLEEGMEHKFEAIRLVQKKSKKCKLLFSMRNFFKIQTGQYKMYKFVAI